MTKIYFANGLFSEQEARYNEYLVGRIRKEYPAVDVYLPQENAAINDKNTYADSIAIAQGDTNELVASDLVITVLDGVGLDAGVAAEIGLAFGKNIPVVGLYTDSRQQGATNQAKLAALQEVAESQFAYINLFVIGLIKQNGQVFNSSDNLIAGLRDYIK